MKKQSKAGKRIEIIDCECSGSICCGGRGIAVFRVKREGKYINVCTRCDVSDDKDKHILRYALKIPAGKLMDFDMLGALCLALSIKDKEFPLYPKVTKRLQGKRKSK